MSAHTLDIQFDPLRNSCTSICSCGYMIEWTPEELSKPPVQAEQCREPVYWYDGEYEGNCERAKNHNGPHYDGLSWYTGEGTAAEEVEAPSSTSTNVWAHWW